MSKHRYLLYVGTKEILKDLESSLFVIFDNFFAPMLKVFIVLIGKTGS